jgi:hypothetical protein
MLPMPPPKLSDNFNAIFLSRLNFSLKVARTACEQQNPSLKHATALSDNFFFELFIFSHNSFEFSGCRKPSAGTKCWTSRLTCHVLGPGDDSVAIGALASIRRARGSSRCGDR